MRIFTLLVGSLFLGSCAGYHLGDSKPAPLAHVNSITIPMFKNSTLHPRAEVLATSAAANALVQDGTYRIAPLGQADAVLEGHLSTITYTALRGDRLDTQRPEELLNVVTLQWVLRDAKDPTKVLDAGTTTGNSQLFATSNLQTARNNALPEALERAAEAVVSRISNGL